MNVVLCLTAVNYMKNDYPLDEFMALLEEIRSTRPVAPGSRGSLGEFYSPSRAS